MIECISLLCVLGVVIAGLLVMTGADCEEALVAVGRVMTVIILGWVTWSIAGTAVRAVLPLLNHVMAWLALLALVVGLLFIARTISVVKRFFGRKENGGSHE
jgi:hypothetical protein